MSQITDKENGIQFVKLLLPFFWGLRDYGFALSTQEIESALCAISNLSDVEDVLYTTQSALCHSKKEADTYQALFCQKFLGYKAEWPKPKEQKNPQKLSTTNLEEQALQKRIEKTKKKLDNVRQSIKQRKGIEEYENARAKAGHKLSMAKGMMDSAKAEMEDARRVYEEERKKALTQQIGAGIKQQIDDFLAYCQQSGQHRDLCKQIRDSLSSASPKDVDAAQKSAMQYAVRARSDHDLNEYKRLVQLASLLQKVAASFRNATHKANIGKDLAAAKSDFLEAQKSYGDASAEYEKAIDANNKAISALTQSKQLDAQESQLSKSLSTLTNKYNKLTGANKQETKPQNEGKIITGPASKTHRDTFIGGHNAVQKADAITNLLNEDIEHLSQDDLREISSYIHSNAMFFKQTLRKIGASKNRHKIDMKRTMEMAMRTDGEIAKLCYQRPRHSKAKIVLLADISGSCRKSTSLTLTFLGLMGDAFPGGCRQFVFVNKLVPVDKYFRENGVEEAVQAINQSVQSRGVYSNYGVPVAQLANEYRGLVGHDTTVLILGDCRNNQNSPALPEMQWLCSHSKNVCLLVTEGQHEWGTADSIVPQYVQCGAKAFSVQSTNQLLDFLLTCGKK